MDVERYQAIKDKVYEKVQIRLYRTPSIKEDLGKKFELWFQALAKPPAVEEDTQSATDNPPPGGEM